MNKKNVAIELRYTDEIKNVSVFIPRNNITVLSPNDKMILPTEKQKFENAIAIFRDKSNKALSNNLLPSIYFKKEIVKKIKAKKGKYISEKDSLLNEIRNEIRIKNIIPFEQVKSI